MSNGPYELTPHMSDVYFPSIKQITIVPTDNSLNRDIILEPTLHFQEINYKGRREEAFENGIVLKNYVLLKYFGSILLVYHLRNEYLSEHLEL